MAQGASGRRVSAPRTSSPDAPANEPLRALAHEALGSDVRIDDVSRGVGRLSIVWRLTPRQGGACFLKQPESRKLFEREDRAYRDWAPQLRGVPGVHLPEVLARSGRLGALVLTSLAETTLVQDLPPGRACEGAHRTAGRFLRALHGLALDGQAPDPVDHMRAMIDTYVIEHAEAVGSATADWLLGLLDEGRPFVGARFVCAHRDYSPRNWVVAPDGTLSVFDWERAQGDVWLADVTRMEFDVWPARPGLRDAFFAGYGRPLGRAERAQIRLAVLIHAVSSVAWAAERGDTAFEALGRRTIRRLGGPA